MVTNEAWRDSAEARQVLDFVALARLEGISSVADQIGAPMAQALLAALRDRVADVFTPSCIGRVGHGTVEFRFSEVSRAAALERLEASFALLGAPLYAARERFIVKLAIGCAELDPSCAMSRSIARAEEALEAALRSETRIVVCAEQQPSLAPDRFALLRDLRSAINGGDLTLVHQPKLNVRTGKIDALEALVRWRHATRGVVPPDAFITLAEDTGDIGPLTRAVLHQAILDRKTLLSCGFDVPIHVNLSGRLLSDESFCRGVLEMCSAAGGGMGLEITETAVIGDPERALRNLAAFAEGGVPIAIDDYGSGLSSLAYLQLLPASELKIDKMFISGLTSSHRGPLIVRSTIDLAHALEMEVTAEGVDDSVALALLKAMGCDRVQGYLVSPPLTLDQLLTYLSATTVKADVVTPTFRMMSGS